MSEQNLLDYNIFKQNDIHNSFNGNNTLPFTFDYAITADQRKVTVTPSNPANYCHYTQPTSFFLPPINATFLPQQPKLTEWKHKVSQTAIIINEQVTTPSVQRKSIDSQSETQPPTHIVSPEAIREALQEEKEEAMGKSDRRPFSQFSSFHALKQRRYSVEQSPPITQSQPEIKAYPATYIQNDIQKQPRQQREKLKRPPNAYLLFNRDMRRKLLSSSEKMTVAEISKEVGDGWKTLPDEQKKHYIKEASLLKEEHLKKYPGFIYSRRTKTQLAEDKKNSKAARRPKTETDVDDTRVKKRPRKLTSNNGQKDPRGRKKKRQKHPFAPKHPMSAYLYYLASVYPKVASEFPGSTVGPISKSISKTWHAMSPEERLPWAQKAELDKARYAREMQIYMATQVSTQQTGQEVAVPLVASDDEEEEEEEDEDEATSQRTFEEEEEEEDDDVNIHTIEAVVNMVNNNNSLLYNTKNIPTL